MKAPVHITMALLLAGSCLQPLWAQRDSTVLSFRRQMQQMRQDFDQYKQGAQQSYAAYRDSVNAEYANFIERQWQEMRVMEGTKPPWEPKPRGVPHLSPSASGSEPRSIPFGEVVPLPDAKPQPAPPDITIRADENLQAEEVNFYATKVVVRRARSIVNRLTSISESEVAKFWRSLSSGRYDALLSDCLKQRKRLNLCDWAYFQFCAAAAEKIFGAGTNESVILQSYLLTNSGYRVRMARSGRELVLLAPFDHIVYNYRYLSIDGQRYYVLASRAQKGQGYNVVQVCQAASPTASTASVAMTSVPRFINHSVVQRTTHGGRYPQVKVTASVDRHLIDFYQSYPLTDAWATYVRSSLSDELKASLYPALQKHISGKSPAVAADMLLDYVQHAFEYMVDQEQFGYERPLFGDESYFYPYNDCEDRSILFAILVRELLQLDVVLLHYPGHLATAVHFPATVKGDYVVLDGKRYTVCDPTYIGAAVGQAMPQFEQKSPKIVKIK